MPSTREMEQIQQDIVRIRDEAAGRLEALEDRISPRRLMDRGMAVLRDGVGGRDLGEIVGRGAIPMLLIAAGLGLWAYTLSRRPRGIPPRRIPPL